MMTKPLDVPPENGVLAGNWTRSVPTNQLFVGVNPDELNMAPIVWWEPFNTRDSEIFWIRKKELNFFSFRNEFFFLKGEFVNENSGLNIINIMTL